MPTPATNKRSRQQADFSHRVKVRLLELGLDVTALAREFGLNRNTVSRAIHHDGVNHPTRARVAARLGISL